MKNLQYFFDQLTQGETVSVEEISPYLYSLKTLLEDYYSTTELFYKADSYGISLTILEDPCQDCYLAYLDSLSEGEEYNEEDYQDFEANFFCYVGNFFEL